MQKIERLLQELKLKDERDRMEEANGAENRTEYLEEQEAKNDEDLRMLL
jgi:hypothetical protein